MAQKNGNTNLTELLLECMAQPDPMLSMLEWLCKQLMEAEVTEAIGAEKSERSANRNNYRCGYRVRRLDTRMGTMYLMVPKLRSGGYIPFFVTERKRSEAVLIQVVQEAFIQGVSTRKMEKLAQSLGIENLSRSQVSEMTKGLNEQVDAFRSCSLEGTRYPVIWADALCEKVRYGGHVVSMAILIVCGVDEHGQREVLAIEPMLEESRESYKQLFESLKERGLKPPSLVISDARSRQYGKAFRVRPGSAARCISSAIFWHTARTRTSRCSRASSNRSGWLRMKRLPENERMLWRKNTRNGSLKRLPRWKTGWKIRWRSILSRSWISGRYPPRICWSG